VVSGQSYGRGPVDAAAHSATRPIVDSPALRLVQALATLFTPEGELAMPEWRDKLAPAEVPADDAPLFEELVRKYAGKPWQEVIPGLPGTGVRQFAGDVVGPEVLARYMFGSQLNIQGSYAGYTGPGARTYTIPERATARLDARLVATAGPVELLCPHPPNSAERSARRR
jgi:Peptidase dimerisation domain